MTARSRHVSVSRWTWTIALAALASAGQPALAQPGWYTAGVGGFNPQIPDFYQHQNWVFDGPTSGWELGKSRSGWCTYAADADVFYDLTLQGYKDLLPKEITVQKTWFDTAYKPADISTSAIVMLRTNLLGKTTQSYLDLTGHKIDDPKAPLVSNSYSVKADGTVSGTTESVFQFTNEKVRAGDDFLLKLLPGTTDPWWKGSFHWVAGAGLDVKNSTVFVADPDSNKGSAAANAGWPNNKDFPGALKSVDTDPIPIPNGPKIGTPASYSTYYAGFTLNNKNLVTGDAADARYTNTVVQYVATISAPKGKIAGVLPVMGGVVTAVAVNSGAETVDKVFIAPTSKVLNSTNLLSFTLPGTTWSATLESLDPFKNSLSLGGVEYDLLTGLALSPGEIATATLGTIADFSSSGFEIFLHFTGDPSNLWDPEVEGGFAADPAGPAMDQASVPEPSTLVVGLIGVAFILVCAHGASRGDRKVNSLIVSPVCAG